MYQEERLYRIVQILKEKKSLSKTEIMEALAISRDTARRDIVRLVEQGAAIRTHGGIAPVELHHEILGYGKRASINREIKKKIARFAAAHLARHQVCFFDVSTTVEELCDYVTDNLEIYTHSLDNVERLSHKKCTVRMLGGKLNRKHRYCYGSDTLAQIEHLRFDLAVLGTCGIRADGIYIGEHEDAAVKRKVAERSNSICVLADDSKFNAPGNFRCIPLKQIDLIITNRLPPDDLARSLENSGTTLELI